jgi:hypothetical protein
MTAKPGASKIKIKIILASKLRKTKARKGKEERGGMEF